MSNSRRKALKTLGAVAVVTPLAGQHEHHNSAALVQVAVPAKTGPKFFSASQMQSLSALTDVIIPPTDTPGASAAGVPSIIDGLASRNPRFQASWGKALEFFEKEAKGAGTEAFASLSKEKQVEVIRGASEAKPGTDGARAFELLKSATIDAYYTTRAGLVTELGWNANTFLLEFKGCTHEEHQG